MKKTVRIFLLAASIMLYPLGGGAAPPEYNFPPGVHRIPAGPEPVPGWPVILGNCIRQALAVADIDGDGREEIAAGVRDGRVFLLGPDGRTLPGWPREMDSRCMRGMMLDDIDGDGVFEVAAVSFDGMIHMWKEDGGPVEGWPVDLGGIPFSAPTPIEHDGMSSILVSSSRGGIFLLSPDGKVRDGWPRALSHVMAATTFDRKLLHAADIEGGDAPEILYYSTRETTLYAWNVSGEECEGFPKRIGTRTGRGMAVDDPDDPRHIALSKRDSIMLIDVGGRAVCEVFPESGDSFFTAPHFISSTGADRRPDLLVGCTRSGGVCLWDLEGRMLDGWPVHLTGFIYGVAPEQEQHLVYGRPLACDSDGDGTSEIIVGCYDQHLYCFDLGGRLLPGWPVLTGDALIEGLALAQLDGRGPKEVVAGQMGETMFAFSLEPGGEGAAGAGRYPSGTQRPVSEWPASYWGVTLAAVILFALLMYYIHSELGDERGPDHRLVRIVGVFLVLVLSVRIVLMIQGMQRYERAEERLRSAETVVAGVIERERLEVRSLACRIASDIEGRMSSRWDDPLLALRNLERTADHFRLDYRFNGLMLADRSGRIIQGVGLARGWTDLSQILGPEQGRHAPSLLGETPVFVEGGGYQLQAGGDTLRLLLVSSILDDVPNAAADSTGCTSNMMLDGRTLALGGTAISPPTGLRPWLGVLHPGHELEIAEYPGGSRLSIFLTIEDFERPFIKWVDLGLVVLMPLLYLSVVLRRKSVRATGPKWWWVLSFGAVYVAGTVLLSGGRLQPSPVPLGGRILEVLLHMTGMTGVIAALHAIITSQRGRRLDFALLVSYLVVSLIPMMVIMVFLAGIYHTAQQQILNEAVDELETRADNMVLAYLGNWNFISNLNSRAMELRDQPPETGWFDFVSMGQYLFNYDLPTAYITLWAKHRDDPENYFTGFSHRAPRTAKLYSTRPGWTGRTKVSGLFLDDGIAVIRAMRTLMTNRVEAQLASHIPVDRHVLADMERRLRILPFLPRVHLQVESLDSGHRSRPAGLYIPLGGRLPLAALDWDSGATRRIAYETATFLPYGAEMWRVLLPLVFLILLPFGLSFWGAWSTFRRTARPMSRLLDGIKRVEDGDLDYRLEETGMSEIGVTARAFDRMADSLKRTVGELAEKKKVEEVSELKSSFISMVSHDLKTPLSSIRGATENILEELAGPVTGRQRRYLGMIIKSSDELQRMITDLLDLSRIESGRMVLELEELDIAREAGKALRSLRPLLEGEGIEGRISVSTGETSIKADRARLWQILSNIISNAVRHSPDGGTIDISISEILPEGPGRRRMIRVAIADQGPGIAEMEKRRLFEPFYSRPSTRTGKRGAGLGLAITRELVDLHGGSISVFDNPGGGAVFEFTLPA